MPFDWKGLLLGLVPLLAGIGIIANGVTTMQGASAEAREAEAWPAVVGRVTRNWVETGTTAGNGGRRFTTYTPRVAYSYQAQGSLYLNDRLSLSQSRQQSSRGAAEEELKAYPVGAPVTVRYDPRSPRRSALIIEGGGNVSYIGLAFGGLLALFGGYVLVMMLRRPGRRPEVQAKDHAAEPLQGTRSENQAAEPPQETGLLPDGRFTAVYVSLKPGFSLDRDNVTGRPAFGIPVSTNQWDDHFEWYSISEEEFDLFMADHELATEFARRCASRKLDDRLLLTPGSVRGNYIG